MRDGERKDLPLKIRYVVGARPEPEQLAALRESVGWDGDQADYPRAYAGYSTTVGAYSADGALIGWAALVSDNVRHAFFVDVIVNPSWQRQGVGRQLVARSIEAEQKRGISLFHADFDREREAFYAACGFTLGSGGYIDKD